MSIITIWFTTVCLIKVNSGDVCICVCVCPYRVMRELDKFWRDSFYQNFKRICGSEFERRGETPWRPNFWSCIIENFLVALEAPGSVRK